MAKAQQPKGKRAEEQRSHYQDRAWSKDEAVATLESPKRATVLDPIAFWDRVDLAEQATVVDVGSGTGYFAVPAARIVGLEGHVYAVDISRELVDYIAARSRDEHLPQLAAVQSTVDTIPLPSGIADVVLLSTVLHDISPATVAEAVRLLRPTGQLIDLDWKKTRGSEGPPYAIRLSPPEATHLLGKYDLAVADSWEPGPQHYALIFVRAPFKRRSR